MLAGSSLVRRFQHFGDALMDDDIRQRVLFQLVVEQMLRPLQHTRQAAGRQHHALQTHTIDHVLAAFKLTHHLPHVDF